MIVTEFYPDNVFLPDNPMTAVFKILVDVKDEEVPL